MSLGDIRLLVEGEKLPKKGVVMPQIFIDDGLPDAGECDSNYILYDENNLESMMEALELLEQSKRIKSETFMAQKRLLEKLIEKKKQSLSSKHEAITRSGGPLSRLLMLLSHVNS